MTNKLGRLFYRKVLLWYEMTQFCEVAVFCLVPGIGVSEFEITSQPDVKYKPKM
jgi:hypothetical protein